MAENDATPNNQGGATPPASTDFEPAAPLKQAGVEFDPSTGASGGGGVGSGTTPGGSDQGSARQDNGGGEATGAPAEGDAGKSTGVRQALAGGAGKVSSQVADKARSYAMDGQARAGSALDQLSQMLTDAATQVDDKIGAQYGDYARQAASTVSGFAESVKNKEVDELFDDARAFVRKSPGVAIGAAAAVGFAIARLVQAGVDAERNRSDS